MPLLGSSWNHDNIAEFYTNIQKHGYQMLYLTARAIGQSESTRNFLNSVKQGDCMLPPGPVIMSPDRLFSSFKREVIDRRPDIFKI